MLYSYSVTPLKDDHFAERCADIVDLHKRGVITMPLFEMVLVPEGDPVWDKVGPAAQTFARYREALEKEGVPAGILVQASLGHGYDLTLAPFTQYENLIDGKAEPVYCPEDPRFLSHFCDVLRTIAKERPAAIMLDDDFRMIVRPGKGCVCPYHVAEFNRRAGTNYSRDQLREAILAAPFCDPITLLYEEIQRDTLIKAAKAFRAAIDEIDPTIQGINCTSGHFCDSVVYTNPIFAGKNNPTVVRAPNGSYAPVTDREFSDGMRQAAICSARLKKHGIQYVLAETDTIPYNRYAKSAAQLHAHYVASLLEGLCGAKHWLTRFAAYEPESGRAFRKILSENVRLYERAAKLAGKIRWIGINSAFIEQEHFDFRAERYGSRWHNNFLVTENLERMGLPFYFSETFSGATFLEGGLAADLPDEKIKEAFAGSVFVDGESAAALVKRGYGDLLGVGVSENDARISGECFDLEGQTACTAQKNPKKLTVTNRAVEILSYNYAEEKNRAKILSPAVTALERKEGLSVVFCGSSHAEFKYTEGFAFLNETRKGQLIALFQRAGVLPVYAMGDAEICFRAGYLPDGSLFAAAYPLGLDCAETLSLHLETAPKSVSLLHSDGRFRPAHYAFANGVCTLKTPVRPMMPILLKIGQ
ncbi:MAG: hypothetical protein IKP74_05555 [Clostridia bacterium]|nr:hypothetical protein [Clostridia bacterium]